MKLKRKVSVLGVSVCACVYACALQPHVLPARLLWPWDFPGKNTGVAYHFLLQGNFLAQGSSLRLLHCRQILYHLVTCPPNHLIKFLPNRKFPYVSS